MSSLHHVPVWVWLTLVSVVSFVVCIVGIPLYLARAPADLLVGPALPWRGLSPRRLLLRLLKNALGLVLFVAGLIMLVGPGQGLLTLIVALGLLDLPGKRRLQRRLLLNPKVLKLVNRLRERAGRDALEPYSDRPSRSGELR